jgi:hypothetical protein
MDMTSGDEIKGLIDPSQGLDAAQQADLARTDELLRALSQRLTVKPQTDDAYAHLASRLAASRRQLIWTLVLIVACIAAPFAMLLRGPLPAGGMVPLLTAIAAAGILLWTIIRKQSAMKQWMQRGGDFHESWAKNLVSRIRETTIGAVLVAGWSAGFFVFSALGSFGWLERTVVLGVAVMLGVGALRALFVERRELQDELNLVRGNGAG